MKPDGFTTIEEAFGYLESFLNLERGTILPRTYRLDRMEFLLALFDHPEKAFQCIHVAGSKGKGSTSLYIASLLTAAGFRTGLYMSPHVVTYRERITKAGAFFPDDLLISGISGIREVLSGTDVRVFPGGTPPTTFELLTLLGFLTFRNAGCSWAVIETGIGGRLDATNTVLPAASVITPIELEHTDILGTTIPEIAFEKAGIIKPGKPLFLSRQRAEADAVFASACRERGSSLHRFDEEIRGFRVQTGIEGTRTSFTLADGFALELTLSMTGDFQAENAALASLAVHSLFPDLPSESFRTALEPARLPGRMELIHRNPPVILDAAHTPSSVERLIRSFRVLFPEGGVLLFGSVLGKNPEAMALASAANFGSVIISTPGTFKKSDPEHVYECFRKQNENTFLEKDPREALRKAFIRGGNREPILVTGSFYMVAEIRSLFQDTAFMDSLGRPEHDRVS